MEYNICGVGLAAPLLWLHLEPQHDVYLHAALSPNLINENCDPVTDSLTMDFKNGLYA